MFTQVWGNVDYPPSPVPSLNSPRNEDNSTQTQLTSEADLPSPKEALLLCSDHGTISVDPISEPAMDIFSIDVQPASIIGSSSPFAIFLSQPPPGITASPRLTRNAWQAPFEALRSRFLGNSSTPPSSLKPLAATPSETQASKAKEYRELYEREVEPQGVLSSLTMTIGFLNATGCENRALSLSVCKRASASKDNAKEAARALRKEFKYGHPRTQLSAVKLWAIMLCNSSEVFVVESNARKFINVVEELILSPKTTPLVRERVLDVLGAAAFASISESETGFTRLWRKYKAPDKPDEGIPLDTEDYMFNSPPPFPSDNDLTVVPLSADTSHPLSRSFLIQDTPIDHDGDVLSVSNPSSASHYNDSRAVISQSELPFIDSEPLDIPDMEGDWWHARKADETVEIASSHYPQIPEPTSPPTSPSASVFRAKALYYGKPEYRAQ
ncbi:hypothetical protein V5O48_013880 [Marasmius crinis-equi]|uniref:VHS domain-containing protein n=1 Tax=Marasmius crinis-equi TaxID=585013 RepID=A0ABR3EYU2_9AGAR